MRTQSNTQQIRFHPEQVRYLEKLFPQMVLPATATIAEMQRYFGQQSVLQILRENLVKYKVDDGRG